MITWCPVQQYYMMHDYVYSRVLNCKLLYTVCNLHNVTYGLFYDFYDWEAWKELVYQ